MRTECISAVETDIGRKLKKSESDAIQDKINYQLNELRRTEPDRFASMTDQKRVLAAAKAALEDHIYEAEKKAARSASNVLAQAREINLLAERAAEIGGKQPFHAALFERMRQLDIMIKGERNRAFSQIVDTIHASESKFLGLVNDPQAQIDFVKTVFGEPVNNPVAAKGAKVWGEQIELIRLRANEAGANIGKLDYGYLPQPHSVGRIFNAGQPEWTSSILPLLDRSRYMNLDGTIMNDAQLTELLSGVYETITTDGLNKAEAGANFGKGGKAGKFDDAHRSIHFKDADSYLDYMNKFGSSTVFEAMQSHVGGMIKDITLMEQFGASPNTTFKLLHDTAKIKDVANSRGFGYGREFSATPEMVWATLTGSLSSPVNVRFGEFNQGVRNFMTATKLQGAMLSSLTDLPTLAMTAGFHGMPIGKTLVNTLKNFDGDYRENAVRMGLTIDSVTADMVRWHGETLAQGWSAKLASTTIRVSGLEAWTNGLRRSFSVDYQAHLGGMVQKSFTEIKPSYQKFLKSRGITEADWQVWQQAKTQDWNGAKALTADSIAALDIPARQKNEAIAKLLGLISDEAGHASLEPSLMARSAMMQGTQKGTLGGEAIRHALLFKSFPIGLVERHLRRINEIDSAAGKLAYSASLMATLTLFGAITVQLKDIASGKDPRDMTGKHAGEFWAAAFLQGGGAGIFGDILYTGMGGDSRGGQKNWTNLLGPVFGTAMDLSDLTLGNLGRAMDGKETHFGANTLRLARQNTPFVNLWYAKAAIDHAFMHEIQETVSPGYLRKMKQRTKRELDQGYWWEPGESTPDHAPDLGAAFGAN